MTAFDAVGEDIVVGGPLGVVAPVAGIEREHPGSGAPPAPLASAGRRHGPLFSAMPFPASGPTTGVTGD